MLSHFQKEEELIMNHKLILSHIKVHLFVYILYVVSKFSNLFTIQNILLYSQAIRIQVPIGIPTADGGLEIPNRIFLGGIPSDVCYSKYSVPLSSRDPLLHDVLVTMRDTFDSTLLLN